MKPQTLVPSHPTATAEHCGFAVQGIKKLVATEKEDFGGRWPWLELLRRPRTTYLNGAEDSVESFVDRLYAERPPHMSDSEVLDRAVRLAVQTVIPDCHRAGECRRARGLPRFDGPSRADADRDRT